MAKIQCPGCKTILQVTAEQLGKPGKCPQCELLFNLPVSAPELMASNQQAQSIPVDVSSNTIAWGIVKAILLLVLVPFAVVVVVAVVTANIMLTKLDDDADIAKAKTDISTLKAGVKTHVIKTRKLPNSLEEVAQFLDPPKIPVDPWGNTYIYTKEGSREYTIVCYGADGTPGGDGIDADLSSLD